ncbi:MAG TPA: hypothetical protein PKN45_10885 [Candidatus Limiplasma sp.]|nr:hypothetical protein [Candidatus Limiplasma sp.]
MLNSIRLSIPKDKKVRGYVVKRMPLGAYLKALEALQDFPQEIAMKLIPNCTGIDQVLVYFKTITKNSLVTMIVGLMSVVPEKFIELVSQLTEIPYDSMIDDPNIGLDGLAEIVAAWLEVNGTENFLRAASQAIETGTKFAATLKSGSKG